MNPSLAYQLACVLVAALLAQPANCLGRHLLKAPEMKLITKLWPRNVGAIDATNQQAIQVREYYSNRQQRARLELHPSKNPAQADGSHLTYYYDNLSGNKRLLRVNQFGERAQTCESCDINSLAHDMFGSLSKMVKQFSGESWQELGLPNVPGHIIGPSRILFMIDQNRQLLCNRKTRANVIKDQEAISYDFVSPDLTDLEVTVIFAATKRHLAEGDNDLPFRVLLKTQQAGPELLIEFFHPHEIQHDFTGRHQKELDLFSFPVGLSCSSGFSRSVASSEWFVNPQVRVASYQARVTEHLYQEEPGQAHRLVEHERFVAYDLLAKAMRVDTIQPNKYSTDIYDFNRNHIYNLVYAGDDDDGVRTSESPMKTDLQCIATSYHKCESYTKFLDFSSMQQMGRATVRGLGCMVFEQVTRDLPPALFSYLNYRNRNGVFFKRAFEQSEQALADDSEPYNIVYYFVAQNFEPKPRLSYRNVALGPLVQADVYQSGKIMHTFSITDFVYHLSDAPNGDQRVDLFALRDRCGSRTNNNAANYAQATFQLNYQPSPASGSAKEVAQLYGAPMLRDEAIIRAISSANSVVSATQIYDVESSLELRGNDDQLVVRGACRLVHADVESVVPRVVGAANFWSQTSHTSFEDCFWQAARRRRSSREGRVLFVACRSHCVIDDSPKLISNGTGTGLKFKSDQFIISDKFSWDSCAVMLIEEEEETQPEEEQQPLRVWNQAYATLKGSTLRLALANDDDTNPDEKPKFTMHQLELSNDRWSSSLGYVVATLDGRHSSSKGGELLNGIGLTTQSGHLERGIKSWPTEMSFAVCHSICMANMSCRSFSVCLTARNVECITSQVDIGNPSLLAQVELGRKESKAAGARLIRIAQPAREAGFVDEFESPMAENTDVGEQTIEFRVDIRCRLYKKDALEMFHMAGPTEVELKDANMRPVNGPAQCAELCLNSNLAFFNKMSEIRHQSLLGSINDGPDETNHPIVGAYTSNLSLWCSSFRYLNLLDHSVAKNELAAGLKPEKLNQAGLCSLMRPILTNSTGRDGPASNKNSNQAKSPAVRLQFEQYRFVYTGLFDAQFGVRMARGAAKEGRKLETVRLWASNAETCARVCFLQTSSLRPWCKSFDLIEKPATPLPPQATGKRAISSYCVLNSLSFSDFAHSADEPWLERGGTNVSVWHYEPKDTFSIDSLAEVRALALADVDAGVRLLHKGPLEHLAGLWVFVVILLALLCSSWLVVSKGDTIIGGLHRRRSPGSPSSPSVRRIRFQLPDQIDLAEIHD